MTTSSLYDEYYYSHDCGRPYQRDEVWLTFFDQIAKRIIEQFEPKTVLDAGCAWGFLVEAFRNRGVEAFGVDISEYAIQNIYPDIKPYCWLGSITEPFPKKYELITCIEVLEHMPQKEAEKAIENLCTHANEIVFSSTPFDYKEATHFNVHDPEYWAEQFARYGFYRDMEADLSCITSWAVRFVKTKRTSIKLVREYERKFWQLKKENFDLRQLSIETQDRLRQQENQVQTFGTQVAEKEQVVQALTAQVAEKEQVVQALTAQVAEKEQSVQALQAQLNEIVNSKAWKIALFFRRIRVMLAPPNSRRARVLRRLINIIFVPFKKIRRNRKLKGDLALVRSSGLFDEDWYLANNPDVAQAKVEPLLHYLRYGGFEGRDPNLFFDSDWYLTCNPDVASSGMNPLLHYIRFGATESRDPNPFNASGRPLREDIIPRLKQIDETMTTKSSAKKDKRVVLRAWQPARNQSIGVNFIGPVDNINGLSTSARGYISSLLDTSIPINVIPWKPGFEHLSKIDVNYPSQEIQSINLVHLNLDLLDDSEYLDRTPLKTIINPMRYNVCIIYWELMSIRPEWLSIIHRFDEIWCASSFMARSISAVSAHPVRVVRPALDFKTMPSNRDRQSFGLPSSAYVFFYAADAGGVMGRKNPGAFIDAYVKEFTPEDGACCLIKIHYATAKDEEVKRIVAISKNRPDVIFMNQTLSSADMSALFRQIDCYVSPHRSEGLGLTVLEAMAAEKPVIATQYGGVTDFVTEDTAFLLDYRLIEVGSNNGPYPSKYIWADPKIESIQKQMRYVFENRTQAKELAKKASINVRKLFSIERTSNAIREELDRIWCKEGSI